MMDKQTLPFSEDRALQTFEKRHKAFRVIYDTIFAVEGVDEEEIPGILCQNLLKVCQAQSAALTLYDADNRRLKLLAVARVSESGEVETVRPHDQSVVISQDLVDDLKQEQVKQCSGHKGCLVGKFPYLSQQGLEHACNSRCYRLSSVRDDQLIAAGMAQLYPGDKLRMKDMVDTYLNLAGMVLQRLNMIRALRKNTMLYHSTIDAIDGYLHVVDREFNIMLYNRALGEQLAPLGISGDIIGHQLFEVFPFLDENVREQYRQLLKDGNIVITEESNQLGGHQAWTETTKIPILDDQGDVDRIVTFVRDITERKRNENSVKSSLREKEVLLKEIHHRVKNNLQVINSLLSLQARNISDPEILRVLKESQNRVRSMALIHEKLYRSTDLSHIDFSAYISSLIQGLARTYQVNAQKVKLNVDVQNAFLEVDYAVPCGLIINELIANSFKYAFPPSFDKMGQIDVRMRKEESGRVHLLIGDNGVGLPADVDFQTAKTLGLRMVNILVEDQLDGELEMRRDSGTVFEITFSCACPMEGDARGLDEG